MAGTGHTYPFLAPYWSYFLDNQACTRSIMIAVEFGGLADLSQFEIDNAAPVWLALEDMYFGALFGQVTAGSMQSSL
jgi:hypothetical protein